MTITYNLMQVGNITAQRVTVCAMVGIIQAVDRDGFILLPAGGGSRSRNCLATATFIAGSELHRGDVVCL